MADFDLIENLPFTTQQAIGARARLGLVVLASDYTLEHEIAATLARSDMPEGLALYVSRIANSPQITPDTLAAMGPNLTETAERLLPGDNLDVLAYGCTSASMVLGPDAVNERLTAAKPMAKPTNPASAAFAALTALKAKRIAVLTPYTKDVNAYVADGLTKGGFKIEVFGSFNEPMDPVVSSIDPQSLNGAIDTITKGRDVDAVFVSCTSVRLMDAVAKLERETGLPVTSSNHAMIWHMLRLAGVNERFDGLGRLYTV
ncbi:Asp/Glu racemase [Pseudahrensia aquimaris]|uniref:Asp/Glu racemase n=1 Tax=Pseudahrensia aquimaris TaxID=744461 RepID=A0ABW3FIH2_9HYPH